ncbi:MAG: DPP IV N-terminal domain-containing protein [Novosphingobium sp.]|uniref:S9 family peptidase n=1 Tax=Novosphingobium sp. TaxID=1874826 RepID=UPI0032B96C7F
MRFALLSAALSAAAALLAVSAVPAGSETVSAARPRAPVLSFERVFASPSLSGPVPRGVKLSPDGRWLTVLKSRPDDRERYDLWGFDRKAGKWRMLLDSTALSSGRELSEAEKMQRERQRIGDLKGVVSYYWREDSAAVLVPLDGELFLVHLDGRSEKLGGVGGDLLNPALSPKGQYVSFVRDRRLWVGKAGADVMPVTPMEPADTIHWGEAEFVAQEEMGRIGGYWWAPDEARIAVQRFDDAGVGIVTRTAIGAEATQTFQQRYPAAGTANSDVSLFIMNPDGSARVPVDLGPEKDIYLARIDWAPDGKVLYVQRQNRAQTVLDMLRVDPATGKSQVLFTERAADKSWINLSDNYRFLRDGSLIWWSERDGFGHLYHFKNGTWRQLTKGDWVVTELAGVDQKLGRVYFTANKDDVLAPQVYALDLAKPDKAKLLSEPGYYHTAAMDKAGQTLLITRSSPTQPSQVYIADGQGKRLSWVEENRIGPAHPYGPHITSHHAPQYGTIKAADGTALHWKMTTPRMEPGKRYPVFFDHYGGPTAQVVKRSWASPLEQAIVARGFIYFQIDNRGSENRGVKFGSALYRAMGGVEVEDQKAGALFLKGLPYVDGKRIATYGWSYGGYMTIKMLQADPGLYAAGIAGAPVTRWELYDTHYTERYLGDPRLVPQVYASSNALANSGRIKDPLFIIHGMADDNVVFENSSMLISRLQAEAVPFEMMLYPGYTHRVGGPKVGVHLWNSIFAFLDRNMPAN